jgi:septum formation topological specificity factor MinE
MGNKNTNSSSLQKSQQGGCAQRKNNEKLIAIEKCRNAILHVLGRYMIVCMESVEIEGGKSKDSKKEWKAANESIALCDLEEVLVPYYVSVSRDIDHARTLFI